MSVNAKDKNPRGIIIFLKSFNFSSSDIRITEL